MSESVKTTATKGMTDRERSGSTILCADAAVEGETGHG